MPSAKTKRKLSAEQKLKICSLAAVGYNAQRISDILDEEDGVTVTLQNIYYNYLKSPKYKKIIAYMAERAQRKVLAHPLAKKINRLNILKDAINEAFTWRLDKINYDHDGNELSRVEKRNIGMIAGLINEARKEIEGDKPLIDNSVHNHYQFFSHIIQKAKEIPEADPCQQKRF